MIGLYTHHWVSITGRIVLSNIIYHFGPSLSLRSLHSLHIDITASFYSISCFGRNNLCSLWNKFHAALLSGVNVTVIQEWQHSLFPSTTTCTLRFQLSLALSTKWIISPLTHFAPIRIKWAFIRIITCFLLQSLRHDDWLGIVEGRSWLIQCSYSMITYFWCLLFRQIKLQFHSIDLALMFLINMCLPYRIQY